MQRRDITAGLTTAIVMIASCISYSAAVFSGPLAAYLQVGIGFGLIGACVTGIIFALASGIPFAIAGPDSKPTAVLAVLAAAVAVNARATGMDDSSTAAMALTAVLTATVLTGIVLYLFGRWKMGQWVRFVPFSVIGGFMAASGWLLMKGALVILTRIEPSASTLAEFTSVDRLEQLAAGIVFAGAMVVVGRSKSMFGFPALLAGAALAAHAVRWMQGVSVAEAQQSGWLLQVPPGSAMPAVWLVHHLTRFHALSLLKPGGDYLALIVVTAFTLLLGITSIEVDARLDDDVDVDRELRVNGIANVVAGLAGGMGGTLSLSRTLFNFRNGARSRVSGLIAAACCGLTLAFGTRVLAFVPVPILGGMLLRLGTEMFDEWLIKSWRRMDRSDYAQVAIIFLSIVIWGFMAGIAVGIVAACVTFAITSSSIPLVKREVDRSGYSSRVDRSPMEVRELVRNGHAIQIIWLHGFVFFGSVNRLLLHVKQIVSTQGPAVCRIVILDFREVLGIDSSAVVILVKLRLFAEREDVLIVLSNLSPAMEQLLRAGGFLGQVNGNPPASGVCAFPELDPALEWCEERLLGECMSKEEALRSADEWLARELGGQPMFRQFASYLELVEYEAGDKLFEQGDPAEFVCLVYSGRVSVVYHTESGAAVRLRSMQRHTLIGEMGLYRTAPRGATVLVDKPTVVYRLTRDALSQMEQDDPPLAYAFHKFVVRALAERLDFANREVSALQH